MLSQDNDRHRAQPMNKYTSLRSLRVFKAALFDVRTPRWLKLFLLFAVIYGVSPIDLLPDFIPIGLLDDLLMLLAAFMTFLGKTKSIRRELRHTT